MIVTGREKLALFGGKKHIQKPLRKYNSIGKEELEAAKKVIESGVLSDYIGAWHEKFYGGPKVREFEQSCQDYFNVDYVISVNSATSALIAAVGAIGIEPGDEVIVSPWTMCASATAILNWNAIPVFADIDPETFCLDLKSVEANISPHTKAIMAVDIFGQSADLDGLRELANKYNLKIISDTAQSPGAKYKGKLAGTLSNIGSYSLNYHKHIHTGEGGILVTNDANLAERMQLIRNHAEAVVGPKNVENLSNMIGYNFRLGEIECAIGIEQLKKLDNLVLKKQQIAEKLNKGLCGLPGLELPKVRDDCTHVYYFYGMKLNITEIGTNRERIHAALKAEGVEGLFAGYQNIHLLPLYQKKIAYGSAGFPWSSKVCKREITYQKGICPVAEKLHDKSFLGLGVCLYEYTQDDIDAIIGAFHKVWASLLELK